MTSEIDLQKLEKMFDEAAKSAVEKMTESAKKKVEKLETSKGEGNKIDVS